MCNQVIYLVSVTHSVNEYGDLVPTRTERPVFADVRSITRAEFYQAEAVGMKPEVKFVLADYLDYQKEDFVKYTDVWGATEIYKVLRTYKTDSNQLEIVAKKGIE